MEKLELIHASERRLREACIYQTARRPGVGGPGLARTVGRRPSIVVTLDNFSC